MIENISEIKMNEIVPKAQEMLSQGYRFVTMDCMELEEGKWQLIYHFDKDLSLVHFRVLIENETTLPSISPVYLCALLIENEVQDLFGLKFTDLAIDYNGKLLLTEDVGPAPQRISNLMVRITEKDQKGVGQDG